MWHVFSPREARRVTPHGVMRTACAHASASPATRPSLCSSVQRRVHFSHRPVTAHVAIANQIAAVAIPARLGGWEVSVSRARQIAIRTFDAPLLYYAYSGLSASGCESSAATARHTDCSVQAGVHASGLRMSRQISPVL